MKYFSLLLLTLMLSLTSTTLTANENNDLLIDADNQDLDYNNNTLRFMGNVIVRQGKITIEADELFVITNNGNSDKLIATGNLAIFSQLQENGETLQAKAKEITYLVEAQQLNLKGSASFQQGGSVVNSETIEFDLANKRVKADGGNKQNGRVSTRLKAKQKPQ